MQLEWNAGGWFGGQLGSTLWIFIAGIIAADDNLGIGLLLMLIFLLANIIGSLLWRRRRHMSCYIAMQVFLPIVGFFGLLAVTVLDKTGLWQSIQTGSSVPLAYGLIVGIIAMLMLIFYFRFGRE